MESDSTFDKLVAGNVDTLLGPDCILDGPHGIVRVYIDCNICTIDSNLDCDLVVVSSNDGVCNDARIKDGLVVIEDNSILLKSVDGLCNTLLALDGFSDCLNLIVGININSELSCSKFNLDAD